LPLSLLCPIIERLAVRLAAAAMNCGFGLNLLFLDDEPRSGQRRQGIERIPEEYRDKTEMIELAIEGTLLTFPRNCGQSEKLLQQHQEDWHGFEEKTLFP